MISYELETQDVFTISGTRAISLRYCNHILCGYVWFDKIKSSEYLAKGTKLADINSLATNFQIHTSCTFVNNTIGWIVYGVTSTDNHIGFFIDNNYDLPQTALTNTFRINVAIIASKL